jgi:hypothetical protein
MAVHSASVRPHRLLQEDVFASLSGSDGHRHVQLVRRRDHYDIDGRVRHQLVPVAAGGSAMAVGKAPGLRQVAIAYRRQA